VHSPTYFSATKDRAPSSRPSISCQKHICKYDQWGRHSYKTRVSSETKRIFHHIFVVVLHPPSSVELSIVIIPDLRIVPIMGTSAPSGPGPAADSGPSALEIVIGILALVLALAAVAVAIVQVQQARAARGRQTDTESQTNIELSRSSSTHQASAQVLVETPTISRRYFTMLRHTISI
jgi:hypothetical protein